MQWPARLVLIAVMSVSARTPADAAQPRPEPSRPGVVITTSGQRLEGEVIERADEVVVSIRGVQTVIARFDIVAIEYPGSFDEQFRRRLNALEPGDAAGRIDLARWAMSRDRYDAARDALELALAADPNSAEATELLSLVQSTLRTRGPSTRATTRPTGGLGAPDVEPRPAQRPVARKQGASDEVVQAVRRAEWRLPDESDAVRVRIDVDAARRFADSQNIPWPAFARLRPSEQARRIFRDGLAEDRAGVTILNDPPALAEFRRVVQPMILSGCATSGCHGGLGAQELTGFALITPAEQEDAAYANFVTLTQWTKRVVRPPEGGVFGGEVEVRLIERGQPGRSLLVQYALPPEVARDDHPDVPNFRPLFTGQNDPRLRPLSQWIERRLALIPADPDPAPPAPPEPAGPGPR